MNDIEMTGLSHEKKGSNMINLIMTGSEEDIQKLTGLGRDGLRDAGFNLDDWAVCFVSDVPLHSRKGSLTTHDFFGNKYVEEYYELDYDDPKYDDGHWLLAQMDNNDAEFYYVEYNGRHYYTVRNL